ncbi:hypothetical protein [uncultured Citricoccus sp.]|uniref:hypothetical protein n=1 Tax=uncultured Citricoccus sp. TaxID=614031 RepID=UPI0026203B45|nr:hypothetical protein [uncultured Citricoccus sp.]
MNCVAATDGSEETIVYDVNGNYIGTVGEIYGPRTDKFASLAAQNSRFEIV